MIHKEEREHNQETVRINSNNLAKEEMVKELLATVLEIDIGAHSSGKAQVYIYIYIYLYI